MDNISQQFGGTYETDYVCLSSIQTLPQTRKTFDPDTLETLSIDIALHGLLHPLIVARFSGPTARSRYISYFSQAWPDESIPFLDGSDILISGERRYRALLLLQSKGISSDEFDTSHIEVKVCNDISPTQAITIQLSENIHEPVPSSEEAESYVRVYRSLLELEPSLSVSQFARQVGRSASYVRDAVTFVRLPFEYQTLVHQKALKYGIALQAAKLFDAGISKSVVDFQVHKAVLENTTVSEFKRVSTQMIQQSNTLPLFSLEDTPPLKKSMRNIVEAGSIKAIWSWIWYMNRVLTLCEEDKLAAPDSRYSERSPVKIFRKLVALLIQVMPFLIPYIPKSKREQINRTLLELESSI